MPAKILTSTPFFVVSDLPKSIDFYTTKLKFGKPNVWGEPPCFAMLGRNGFEVMLSLTKKPEHIRPNGPNGLWDVYFAVDDVALECLELTKAGVAIARPLCKTEYRMWEFEVLDPDGYRICFGQDIS